MVLAFDQGRDGFYKIVVKVFCLQISSSFLSKLRKVGNFELNRKKIGLWGESQKNMTEKK